MSATKNPCPCQFVVMLAFLLLTATATFAQNQKQQGSHSEAWEHELQGATSKRQFEPTAKHSPIVIDLDGTDFPPGSFTDLEGGILFDFDGNGKKIQMAWTTKNRNIGFLWLDRTGLVDPDGSDNYDPCGITVNGFLADTTTCNGRVDSARELFGNVTRQEYNPALKTAKGVPYPSNGFEALRVFDYNHDGVVDEKDVDEKGVKVWDKLHVWVDTCHCGDSTLGKNYTLTELGIKGISLSYASSNRTDENGNQFRFTGNLIMTAPTSKSTHIYDVFFLSRPPVTSSMTGRPHAISTH